MSSETNENLTAMLKAMHKEQKAQNDLIMQRISGIEEQLRVSASKDEMLDSRISGVNARFDTLDKTLLVPNW